MKYLFLIFLVFSGLQVQAQLSPVAQDTFPWFVNYRLPTRVVGTKAPNSIFVMDSTQTKLRAIPTDSITSYIPRNEIVGYKEYVALITQSGTSAPTVTVIYNDLSAAIVWAYSDVGRYTGTLVGAFTANKVEAVITPFITDAGSPGSRFVNFSRTSADVVLIGTSIAGTSGAWSNGVLQAGSTIRIRVYN